MSKPIDRATVASMKKAAVRYKRSNLNQAKMRKPQLLLWRLLQKR